MKKTLIFLALLFALTCVVPQAGAITRHVNVSELEGELTQALRDTIKNLNYNDTVYINFDRIGCDTISGTITMHCNVVMTGLGRCKSTVVLDNGIDQPGFTAFNDDTFFAILGSLEHNISVSITNMSFKLKDHSGIWWESEPKHAVKIYHSNHVTINNVDSYLKNAVCTNFDLRVCSNVSVTNCNIVNYNNCNDGGCLWLRGNMQNITVADNRFYKYGNDETLAVFSRLTDANAQTYGNAIHSNILIRNNDFYYGYDGNDKNALFNDMQFTLMSGGSGSNTCSTNNFLFSDNRFFVNDLTHRIISVVFNTSDTFSNIQFNNNTFIKNYVGSIARYYRNDIEVDNQSSQNDTIFFRNNIFRNDNPVVNPSNDTGDAYFLIQGGKLCIEGNTMMNTVTTDTAAADDIGPTLVWCGARGGDVTLRNNLCRNLKVLARISAGGGISKFKMMASNNSFHGDTRLYCNAIDTLDLVFNNNLIVTPDMSFFLQEFASTGSVVFNNNNVFVTTNYGKLMTHWNSNPTSSYHFNTLEVKNNLFRGVTSIDNLLKYITNVTNRDVSGNICLSN
jgi:hypothetical protein